MYNRYVDRARYGFTPTDEELYDAMGAQMANPGYISPPGNAKRAKAGVMSKTLRKPVETLPRKRGGGHAC